MKKNFLCFILLLTFLFSATSVNALEKGEISAENHSDTSAVSKSQVQAACLLYKKDIDETIFNYLANSKKHFKNRAKVTFTVAKDGSVRSVTLLQSTGNKKNDDFVLNMIKTSAFLKFPKDLPVESMTFQYYINNQKKEIVMATSISSSAPFMQKLLFFDSALMLGDFVLKCCLFHYL